MLPLSDPEVRAEVRAAAEKRLQEKLYGEWFWAYCLAGMFGAVLSIFVVHAGMPLWALMTVLLGGTNLKLYERLNAGSALRLYSDRRRRFALAAAGQQKLLPQRADDPEDADLPHVLELLGARVSGS
ncbi:MAG: hypothetical protein JWN44_4062 [Myxococcales bacterium]|nr:hypothetical protein [Myxococcales bacterium]